MKRIFFIIFALFITGCDNNSDDYENVIWNSELCQFVFVNNNGVQVAVVIKQSDTDKHYFNFPDSIIIPNNEEYSWVLKISQSWNTKMTPAYYPTPPLGTVSLLKLYFNETVLVKYSGHASEVKVPYIMDSYIKTVSLDEKYKYVWTFTFTKEDYQRAL